MDQDKKGKFLRIFLTIILTFTATSLLYLALAVHILAKNPFNIQACLISSFLGSNNDQAVPSGKTSREPAYDHPLLSGDQEKILQNAGIDPASLPSEVSPEMEECFRNALGSQRVDEIISGASPGPLDILKARSCL